MWVQVAKYAYKDKYNKKKLLKLWELVYVIMTLCCDMDIKTNWQQACEITFDKDKDKM